MTKPLPSLALEMSQDGISLHQLAFDGHWHELARVAIGDAALRERLSNMRSIAANTEGRGFRVQLWLPEDQILCQTLTLDSQDATAQAALDVARVHGGKPADYAIRIGEKSADGHFPVAAVRVRTLHEAKSFAKSHGFKARWFGTRASVEGFAQPPHFLIPANKAKVAALGLIAAGTAAVVIGGSYMFYSIDPFNMWETPPKAADFAPFQQPNPAIVRAGAPQAPAGLAARPGFPGFATLSADATRFPLPYLPPRQLTAAAQEDVTAPAAPLEDSAPALIPPAPVVSVNWPQTIAPLSAPSEADSPPDLGFVEILSKIAALSQPEIEAAPDVPSTAATAYSFAPRPVTVANTPFFLEPLPAMATRLSPDALAEFASRSGLSSEQLSRMASPLMLMESKLVGFTNGLPPLPPVLRSGKPLPEQVAPPPAPSGPQPLFTLLQGQPEIRPAFRPAPAPEEPPAVPEVPDTQTQDAQDASVAAAIDAAIQNTVAPPEATPLFSLYSGPPNIVPLPRAGGEFPRAGTPVEDISPANALRPARRPQAIIELPEVVDTMISGAAPAAANRPMHRNEAFAANAARIIALSANRPHTATNVPADPRTVNLPTSASVARSATIENAINLRTTNLIGVFGTADARTALIRMSGGRLVRVQLGQSFSGWTVVAISEDTVRIRKRNREEILRFPAE